MTLIYSLIRSGIEEEVNEIDDLLRIISELVNEFKNLKIKNKNAKAKEDSLYQKGFEAREAAMQETEFHAIMAAGLNDGGKFNVSFHS